MKQLRIVIADDSVTIRDLLRRALSRSAGLDVVGLASDGTEATTMVQTLKPDLVILDLCMPHKSGLDVLREIRHDNPAAIIIMFTGDASLALREACLESGADYYFDKSQLDAVVKVCEMHWLAS